MTESPELAAAMRLLDQAKAQGFAFERIAPGEEGPLLGRRDTPEHRDEIYIAGFSGSCYATRARKYSLIVPGGLPVSERVEGDALTVLHTVVFDCTQNTRGISAPGPRLPHRLVSSIPTGRLRGDASRA